MIDKRRLTKNFLSLSFLQGVNYVLPLITLPYLVRVLGPENFGLVMFAQAFINFFHVFIDYGFELSATKEVSIYRDNSKKITEIYSSILVIKLCLLIIGFISLTIIVFSFDKFSDDWDVYFLAYLMVVGNALFPIWIFQGFERMEFIATLQVVGKLLMTVSIFIFVNNITDYNKVLFINGMGAIIPAMVSLLLIKYKLKVSFQLPTYKSCIYYLKVSTQYFYSRISVLLYTSCNTFIIGLVLGNIAAGYYSAAEKIFNALKGMYAPLNNVLYPYMSKERNISLFKKVFISASVLNLIICVIMFLLDDQIINVIFGKGFEPSQLLLKIFSVAAAFIVPSVLLGYPFLGALGYSNYANYSVVFASIFHIIILIFLIPILSIYTVAFLVLITETIVLLIRLYGVAKIKKNKMLVQDIIKMN